MVLTLVLPGTALPSFALDSRETDSLRRSLAAEQPDTTRVKTLLKLASAYRSDSASRSFYYASEALFLAEKRQWQKGIGAAELMTAICFIDVWELKEAVRHLNRAIKASRITGDLHQERVSWQYLVHCYDHLGERQKALYCQNHLFGMILKTKDTVSICRQMGTLGTVMFDAGRQQEGIDLLKKAIQMAEEHLHGADRNDIAAELLNTLSTVYVKVKKTDSALYSLYKALPLAIAINDTPNVTYLYSSLCDAWYHAGRYDSAEYYAGLTITGGEYYDDLPLLRSYHGILASISERTERHAKALHHYKIADSLAAVITRSERTLERSMQVSRVAIEQQRMHREQEKRDLENINADQRKILLIAIGGLVALGIITGLILRNLRTKANKNKIIQAQAEGLQQQNEVIDAALRDKEILLQEMHHRVKNNLQLINGLLELQVAKLTDKNSIEALSVTQQRVYSIAMVHSRLYHTTGDASVEVHEFAGDLFRSLAVAFSATESDIKFEDRISVQHLPLNMLVPLGLILNELITNSFKHAFKDTHKGTISLEMYVKEDLLIVTYKDSGAGMDAAQLDTETETLGIYLIRRLTRQLKGEMSYSNENGSIFTFTFPYERN